jgi:hypothetical protein
MANKFKPKLVVFKGEHDYFMDGQSYTFKQYSDWTLENCVDGGVMRATIKSRLYGQPYCLPKHLAPKREFIFASEVAKEGYTKERREAVRLQPRNETKSERLSQKWLRSKL